MKYTKHAAARSQQRGIPPFIVELVLESGISTRRNGAEVYYLDQSARKQLRKRMGSQIYGRLEDLLDAYIVVADDGAVITCGHRLKRMKT